MSFYAHGNYEEESGAVNRKIHYIATGSGVSSVFITTNGTGQMYYLHKDHLGSLDVITDDNGAIVEEHSFDAWGRRRNPDNWTYDNVDQNRLLERGYTGHEHLDQFGLINMNGRVYDPVVASFLSPDRYVQSPEFTQSYNRYSYGFNNPLKYTDPTGWIGENTSGGAGEYDGYGRLKHDPLTGQYIPPGDRPGGATGYGYGDSKYGSFQNRSNVVIWVSGSGYIDKKTGRYIEVARHYQFGSDTKWHWEWNNNGQGGRNAADYVELAGDVGGSFGAGAKNILDNRGAYMPRGQIYNMNKEITVRTPIGGINTTSKALNYVRVGGKIVVVAGVLATGYQVGNDISNGNYASAGARAAVLGVAAGAAFIPVVGWGVAAGIGVADFIWGDQLYNYLSINKNP